MPSADSHCSPSKPHLIASSAASLVCTVTPAESRLPTQPPKHESPRHRARGAVRAAGCASDGTKNPHRLLRSPPCLHHLVPADSMHGLCELRAQPPEYQSKSPLHRILPAGAPKRRGNAAQRGLHQPPHRIHASRRCRAASTGRSRRLLVDQWWSLPSLIPVVSSEPLVRMVLSESRPSPLRSAYPDCEALHPAGLSLILPGQHSP